MSKQKHRSAQATLPAVDQVLAPEEVSPVVFESETAEQLCNAGETLKQIAAQIAYTQLAIQTKEQDIEALAIPVANCEQEVTDAEQELEQVALRLKYHRNKATIATDQASATTLAEVVQEHATAAQKLKDLHNALNLARLNYSEQLATLQSELATLQSELATLVEQEKDFTDLQRDLHKALGNERAGKLQSQIEQAHAEIKQLQDELAGRIYAKEQAQDAIQHELADWPVLRDALSGVYGRRGTGNDGLTTILENWLQFVRSLETDGKRLYRPLPEGFERSGLHNLLQLPPETLRAVLAGNVVSFQQREIVELILKNYREKYNLYPEN